MTDNLPVLAQIFDVPYNGTRGTYIHNELLEMGATVTSEDCGNCGGTLLDYENELVCGRCSTVYGPETSQKQSTKKSLWDLFNENRPQYYNNSSRKLCVGGFASTYDWVSSEDTDQKIAEIGATEFYK